MKTNAITRKALYELIWEKSQRKVAQQINVKSQYLKKICVEEDIPTPQARYWVKRKHGKPVFKIDDSIFETYYGTITRYFSYFRSVITLKFGCFN